MFKYLFTSFLVVCKKYQGIMHYFGEDVHVMQQRSPIMWPIIDFFRVD